MPQKVDQEKIKETNLLIKNEKDSRIYEVLTLVKNSILNDIQNQKETVISAFMLK